MTRKTHDLTARVGEYTDNQGNTKGRYINAGAIMEKDDGGKFIFINRTFNPAGVPNPDNRDNVILSMFEVKPRDGGGVPTENTPDPAAPAGEENIPF